MNQNPLQRLFLHMAASSGAQALLIGGLLTGLIGGLMVLQRDGAAVISTALMVVASGSGFVAMGYGFAAWAAVTMEDLDVAKRRTRLGARWVLGSFAILILAGLLR